MVGVVANHARDRKCEFVFNTLFSTAGISYRFATKRGDLGDCDLLIDYGADSHGIDPRIDPGTGLTGAGLIRVPTFSMGARTDWPEAIEARQPPQVSSLVKIGPERVPFYYPFVRLSCGEAICDYVDGGAAIVREGEAVRFGFDIVGSAFYLLCVGWETQQTTTGRRRRNQSGPVDNPDPGRDLLQPSVDLYARLIEDLIRESKVRRGRAFVSFARWPQAKSFAVVLSHDVDRIRKRSLFGAGVEIYRAILDLARGRAGRSIRTVRRLARLLLNGNDGDPYWNFDRWMSLESTYDVRSSFYFMDGPRLARHGRRYSCRRIRTVLNKLRYGGWEIGLHGSYYAWRSPARLKRERIAVEKESGSQVLGHRQHYLRFDPSSSYQTYQLAGLDYDSTLGYNDIAGYRAGTSCPFVPYEAFVSGCGASDSAGGEGGSRGRRSGSGDAQAGESLVEIPLAVMDHALVMMGQSSEKGLLQNLVEKTEERGGCLSLLWHECAYQDYDYPGWCDLGWNAAYEGLLRYVRDHRGWAPTGIEMARWWRSRSRCRAEVSGVGEAIKITVATDRPGGRVPGGCVPGEPASDGSGLAAPGLPGLFLRVVLPTGGEHLVECRSGEIELGGGRVQIEVT